MNTSAQLAIGAFIVGAAIGGAWGFTSRTRPNPLGFGDPQLPSQRPEQLPRGVFPIRPKIRRAPPKRRVAFRVRLDVSPAYEAVVLFPNDTAILYRYRYPVVRFRPAPYQFAKIRAGEGELLIYADQILESLVSRSA